jgi:hypothetical protein
MGSSLKSALGTGAAKSSKTFNFKKKVQNK